MDLLNGSKSKYFIPFFFFVLGVMVATQLRDFYEAVVFLIASIGQFTAYVFVSRLRQRGSFFWHAIAGLAANGMWYATSHILSASRAYWMLFAVYVAGLIAGRLFGVGLAQYIEKKYQLKGDATRDDRLAPGKRMDYIRREPMFWVLTIGLTAYTLYGYSYFTPAIATSLLIVVGLGILQNFFYAVNTRASQRGHNWYIAVTGILSGITFSVSAVYLFSKGMPAALFIPYTLSTALGSTMGAFFSMIFERAKKLRPDTHLEEIKRTNVKTMAEVWRERLPYVSIFIFMGAYILLQEPLFRLMGFGVSQLVFPVSAVTKPIPRLIILLTATILFFLDTALHTLTSRAGNRNHTGYHISTLVPKGTVDFLRVSYLALNDRIFDIIPVAVLAGCLGSLYGKDVAERIERWLQARMDIPEEQPKLKLIVSK